MKVTVKMARVGADLSQAEMAKQMGMSYVTYLAKEKNPASMTIKEACNFCKIVGADFDDIFFGTNSN